jgi:uncharacterized protein (TIGR02996 family)
MTVWFAYRCHYDLPATKHFKRFDDATLLDWFRDHWRPIADREEADDYAEDLLGCHMHGAGYFMMGMAEQDIPPPTTTDELRDLVEGWSVEGEVLFEPHVIQILDDDDELEIASYFFDDHFLKRHRARAAWLMHEDWRLPTDTGPGSFRPRWLTSKKKPPGRWEGTTYLVALDYEDGRNLTDLMKPERIDRVRVPDLARYLAECQPRRKRGTAEDYAWAGPQLRALCDAILTGDPKGPPQDRAFLSAIAEHPEDDANWNVFGDWLEETGRPRAGAFLLERALAAVNGILGPRPEQDLSRWAVSEHLAQICLNTRHSDGEALFAHWVLFDDLWASANADLANALLCAANRWDVLSSPRRQED